MVYLLTHPAKAVEKSDCSPDGRCRMMQTLTPRISVGVTLGGVANGPIAGRVTKHMAFPASS